jgi:hypothetical protein
MGLECTMSIPISVLKNEIVNRQMDLEELIFERLDMNLEDLLYDLNSRLVERRAYFEDLEERLQI